MPITHRSKQVCSDVIAPCVGDFQESVWAFPAVRQAISTLLASFLVRKMVCAFSVEGKTRSTLLASPLLRFSEGGCYDQRIKSQKHKSHTKGIKAIKQIIIHISKLPVCQSTHEAVGRQESPRETYGNASTLGSRKPWHSQRHCCSTLIYQPPKM